MKKLLTILLTGILILSLVGCGDKKETIELPDVTKQLEAGAKLDYVTYEVTTKGEEKEIKVDVAYKEEVMRVGTITAIRNIVAINFMNDYRKIELTITQEEPKHDFVKYIYENDVWDKEVK